MKIVKKQADQLQFNEVEIREATVGDLIQAERIAGKADGIVFVAALLSQVATFDGQKLPAEELYKLSATDLAELGNAVAPTVEDGASSNPFNQARRHDLDRSQGHVARRGALLDRAAAGSFAAGGRPVAELNPT